MKAINHRFGETTKAVFSVENPAFTLCEYDDWLVITQLWSRLSCHIFIYIITQVIHGF